MSQVQDFIAITNASESAAKQYLSLVGGDLGQAIELFFASGGAGMGESSTSTTVETIDVKNTQEDLASIMEKKFLIIRQDFNAEETVSKFPPVLTNSNKKHLYNLACPAGTKHGGTLAFTRWKGFALPTVYNTKHNTVHTMKEDAFSYKPTPEEKKATTLEWHVNFADKNLFVAYGGGLFAQDEIQVGEHPSLASLKEALRALQKADTQRRMYHYTTENNVPTPILIRGAERKIAVDLAPNASKFRPSGLYGNNFMKAPTMAIDSAVTVLKPPTITNMIAIEAIPGGMGKYSLFEIHYTLVTAYTGFLAARIESQRALGKPLQECKTIIHTGNWGTGAYGGNKILMALLQILAARLAGVDELVYHTFAPEFSKAYREAEKLLDSVLIKGKSQVPIEELLNTIEQQGFKWGFSDGN